MSRNKKWTLRSALYEIENMIPKSDRHRDTERERDLITVASCAIWDEDKKKLHRALRRLREDGPRRSAYAQVLAMV